MSCVEDVHGHTRKMYKDGFKVLVTVCHLIDAQPLCLPPAEYCRRLRESFSYRETKKDGLSVNGKH